METVSAGGVALAYLLRSAPSPTQTVFLTPDQLPFQVGLIVYPGGGAVQPHRHLPTARTIETTCEVLLVRSGRCLLDIYDDDRRLVATRELFPGDLALLVEGGHGVRMTEDTVLLEVKQGPYAGGSEKERFEPEAHE